MSSTSPPVSSAMPATFPISTGKTALDMSTRPAGVVSGPGGLSSVHEKEGPAEKPAFKAIRSRLNQHQEHFS